MHRFLHRLTPILAAMALCHCGAPQPPQCQRVPSASRVPAAQLITQARADWASLGTPARASEWPAARSRYNAAVAKLFDQLRCSPGRWDTRAAALGTRIAEASTLETDPSSLDALFPASAVNGKIVRNHKTTDGLGVPLVGWKKTTPVGQKRGQFLLPNGLPYNLTATLAFDHSAAPTWHFSKRWTRDELKIKNASHPLAADWTAPNSFYWNMCELDDLKIQNVILPDRYTEETGIYFVTPYDPKKIPVVLVHGLVSSPDAFKNMINELAPEPWFREHYQIWLYNYPTGNPWLYSSAKFRELMHEACAYARTKGDDTNLERMVIVSHSMGGLLARSSITNPGSAIYDAHFKAPLDQLPVSGKTRDFIRENMLYQPLSEPKRVVFLAVPHRGSPMANLRISTWISRLIRLPKTLTVELLDSSLHTIGDVLQGQNSAAQLPTSINSLSPSNRASIAINKLPLPKNIALHSVIGDRGKGDSPNSSDGIVPYWSSHLNPAASEKIVPCNHSVPDNAAAAEELKRILKLHLSNKS